MAITKAQLREKILATGAVFDERHCYPLRLSGWHITLDSPEKRVFLANGGHSIAVDGDTEKGALEEALLMAAYGHEACTEAACDFCDEAKG